MSEYLFIIIDLIPICLYSLFCFVFCCCCSFCVSNFSFGYWVIFILGRVSLLLQDPSYLFKNNKSVIFIGLTLNSCMPLVVQYMYAWGEQYSGSEQQQCQNIALLHHQRCLKKTLIFLHLLPSFMDSPSFWPFWLTPMGKFYHLVVWCRHYIGHRVDMHSGRRSFWRM